MPIIRVILEETNLDVNLRTKEKGYTPLLSTLSHEYSPGNVVEKALLLLEFGVEK
jgi:hypothetical protein